MNVHDALAARKSVRAFLDRPVSSDTVTAILDSARKAPSGVNTQPWQVAVVTGTKKQELQDMIEAAFRSGEKPQMDYQYYPQKWAEPYKTRRFQCGLQLYETLGIKREEKERRLEQWVANYRAFDAPVMLYFFMDPGMETGSFMDYGMFLQSVMLAAVEEGLGTCPQAALGEYPAIVKNSLGYPGDSVLICGMALGYEDCEATVNSYRTPREPVESFTRFFE
ncbi:MAG: nitroreductase [Desulfocapsaceae bacterium]|jgi:nitroreductase|nr:nitroreductase [Desulfocapsaceae bacterium]